MSTNPIAKENFVFCPPLPGKPGPYAADGISRTRVPQSGQKGDTCGYYALQILRNEHKIGKNPPQNLMTERGIELAISQYRKQCSKVDNLFHPQCQYAELFSKVVGKPCTKQLARQCVEEQSYRILPEHRKQMSTAVSSFCAQDTHDDFLTYVQECHLKAMMEVHEPFLHACHMSDEFIQKMAFKLFNEPWEKLSLFYKEIHERCLAFLQSYLCYECEQSPWHPEQPITQLINQLQLHGPHLVMGQIGKAYYHDAPSMQPQQIEGRSIFYWKPKAPRKEDELMYHFVVIVGAEIDKRGRQLVYFLDPLDGSDPKDMSTQKIYMMSYDRLKRSISDLHGKRLQEQDGQPAFFEQKKGKNNYSLYRNK